ncbi:MAG: NAD(P)-dependent alcohol dehydrogenase, partial [candidate division KSB1 bacterium]
MKAIVYYRCGSPEVLQYDEIEKPARKDDEVLLKVRAASINPLDRHAVRGLSSVFRLLSRLGKPERKQLGRDVAGQVEAVGKNVTRLKPGDEVFGVCEGAFAEYACARESRLVLKPANITFEQAAAAPVAACTALQGLRDKGGIKAGQKVLINGAAGGVGTFAVQIAKSFGAEVTGVCSTRSVGLVRALGAARVIDYTQIDFTKEEQRYDLILDCIGNHTLLACKRVLNPKGICVLVGAGGVGSFLARALNGFVLSRLVGQKFVTFIARAN